MVVSIKYKPMWVKYKVSQHKHQTSLSQYNVVQDSEKLLSEKTNEK